MTKITIERETLEQIIDFLNRVTHWSEGRPDLHDMKVVVRAALASPDSGMVMLMMYRGDLCYRSTHDDQSYGMRCPILWEGIPEGTEFFTTYKEITS